MKNDPYTRHRRRPDPEAGRRGKARQQMRTLLRFALTAYLHRKGG